MFILSLILNVCRDREKLLKLDTVVTEEDYAIETQKQELDFGADGPPSGSWCVVDTDGNTVDHSLLRAVLAEADLQALLNQIPIYDLLKRVVGVQLLDGTFVSNKF